MPAFPICSWPGRLSIPFFPSSDFSVQSVSLSQSVVFSSRFFQRPAGGDNRVVMRRQLKCVGLLLLLLAALSPVVVVATARRGKLAKHAHALLSDHSWPLFLSDRVCHFRQFLPAQCTWLAPDAPDLFHLQSCR